MSGVSRHGDVRGKALSYVHQVTVTARRLAFDASIALALLAGAELVTVAGGTPSRTPPWLRGLLVAAIVVPLAWRRRAPVVVWGVSSAATAAAIATSSLGPAVLAPLVALYTVASRSRRVASMAAGAISLAGCVALGIGGSRSLVVFDDSRIRGNGVLVLVALVAGCWLIGDNLRVTILNSSSKNPGGPDSRSRRASTAVALASPRL